MTQTDSNQDDPGARLHRLFAEDWAYWLDEFPEFATRLGHAGSNHRWTDGSFEAIERRKARPRRSLEVLRSIERSRLSPEDQLDYDLYLRDVREEIEEQRFKAELLPLNQLSGVHQDIAQIIALQPASNVKDYEDIIARLRGVPAAIEQAIARMRRGIEEKVTPARITLRDVPRQVENQIPAEPEKCPLFEPFTRFPGSIPAAEQARLRGQARAAIEESIRPAYRHLHGFLVETYIPAARTGASWSELPGGPEWYAFAVRRYTTLDLSPREIHDLGLAEVKRIRAAMEETIRRSGFQGSMAEFNRFLRTDPRFFFDDPQSLLAAYRDIAKRADPELAKLFGKLPRLPYGVIAIPDHAAMSQTTAYYQPGSEKAGRPGYFFANTYDLKTRPRWEMEALTLHEAVPGHHLQIALAREMDSMPEFRRYAHYTAYIEGWGLYAESLGEAMGFYTDPYSKYGQLTYEMWRAIRLVIDTGIHALGWSRERAIAYFLENSGKAEHDITVEVDRYIAWPGQALAYKIGELKIQELRRRAESELGAAFDVRAFHDEIIGSGALPLDILERRTLAWIEARKGR